jgi:fucose permease
MSTPAAVDEIARFAGTKRASYSSTIVLAINNNIAPLIFIIFHVQFDIPIAQLGLLAALNFGVQFATDFVAMFFVDRIGYRAPMVWANALSAVGLAGLGVFPLLMDSTFLALCLAVAIYAVGGGLLEVLASPIIEHLPTPAHKKASAMAFLHSFYCWGQLLVVVATTLLVSVLGRDLWWMLPIMWAVIPVINAIAFTRVPLPDTVSADERMSIRSLLGTPLFLAALVLMMTGGAAELTMVQWASFFAERGVGVSKEVGDLLGVGLFALLMGIVRFAYGMWGENLSLPKLLGWSGVGAGISYIVAATSNVPLISLLACAVCGAMIALLWPGTMSLTSAKFPYGGAAMFAILALAGDGGASLGPALAGGIAEQAHTAFAPIAEALPDDGGSGLRTALLLCALIPFVFSITVWRFAKAQAKTD